jgi:NitT/TauT family transport system substrate-binding protein
MQTIKIMVSRHSAFYSPLIATIAGGFLAEEGLEGAYAVLQPGQRSRHLLAAGEVEVMQSAVGSNWEPMGAGEADLPVHFAQINQRDGFFLSSRTERTDFQWSDLEGAELLADHGGQPMLMLRYAAKQRGVDWERVRAIDAGGVDAMDAAFRAGRGALIHQQGPAPQQLEHEGLAHIVASVGEAMPPVAFSSLSATRAFLETGKARAFTRAYAKARAWVRSAPAAEVAEKEQSFFPAIAPEALTAAIGRYQSLGCWQGELEIPRDLYEQALDVFLSGGAIQRRYAYEAVVVRVRDTGVDRQAARERDSR